MESIALRPQRCQWHEAGASFSRADASAEPSSLPRSSRGALRGSVPPGGISAGAVPWAADIVAKSGSETTSRARGRFAKFPGCEATVRSAPTTELPRHGHNSAGRSASSEQVERSKATPPAEFLLESFLPKRLRSSRPGTAEPATRERRSSNDSSRLLNPQRAFGSTSRDSNSPRRHSLDSPAWAGTGSAIRRSSSWASADGGRDVSGLAEHKPEALDAAVLILDIVGFSKLCARCTAEGTAGCENFALLVSDYLGRLVSVVEESGGDVEAFAGDALIVIFQDDRSADRSDPPLGLAAIVHKVRRRLPTAA